jgi:hypothetical protein
LAVLVEQREARRDVVVKLGAGIQPADRLERGHADHHQRDAAEAERIGRLAEKHDVHEDGADSSEPVQTA